MNKGTDYGKMRGDAEKSILVRIKVMEKPRKFKKIHIEKGTDYGAN